MNHNIIIGTAGHVDHGKTCLIKALTGIDTDRLKEEKKRGITIELGFAHLKLPNGERAGIIDVPGHEKFIKNMLAGAGGIDLALLIVAADEGVMPQTVEHLGILSLLEIRRGIIVLTKADLVDEQWIELVKEEIREQVKGGFLENAPIFPVSSYTGQGIDELREMIFEMAADIAGKNLDIPFRIPVDRVFTMEGFGTVITGTLIEGTVSEGEEVMLYPSEQTVKIRNLQVHSKSVPAAFAGQRVAVNFAGLKKEEIHRGDVVAAKDSMHTTMMVDVRLHVLAESSRTVKNTSRLHLYHGSREVLCKAVLLDSEELEPGSSGYVQLRLEEQIAVKAGDHFVVRFYSPLETVGGGVVLDANPNKHKRHDPQVLEGLAKKEKGSSKDRVAQAILEYSPRFAPLDLIQMQTGITGEELARIVAELLEENTIVKLTDKLYLHREYLNTLAQKATKVLSAFHKSNPLKEGMKREEIRNKLLPGKELSVTDRIVDALIADNHLAVSGALLRLPEFKVNYSEKLLQLTQQIETIYQQGGYAPPSRDEVLKQFEREKQAPQVLNAMITAGTLVRLDAQLCIHKDAYLRALELIRDYIGANGSLTLGQFRDLLGTSRKYAMAILEYTDKKNITKKVEDARILV